jgi:hypothetical protein
VTEPKQQSIFHELWKRKTQDPALANLSPVERGKALGKADNELATVIGDDAFEWSRDE